MPRLKPNSTKKNFSDDWISFELILFDDCGTVLRFGNLTLIDG